MSSVLPPLRLLASGHKPTFEVLSFDPSSRALTKLASPPAPPDTTWLERHPRVPGVVYASSETAHKVYALHVHGEEVRVVSERETKAQWPVHFAIAKDGSALVTGGLDTGETVLFPLDPSGTISQTSDSPLLTYGEPYPYSPDGPRRPLFPGRQTGPHVHSLEFDSAGRAYICDLGSDTVWLAERVKSEAEGELRVIGKYSGPPGYTPRHSVLSSDEKYLYVNSELQGFLHIHDASSLSLVSSTRITPPHLAPPIADLLLSAELARHPTHPRTLYVSLRGIKRLDQLDAPRGVETPPWETLAEHLPGDEETGDSIAVVLLADGGGAVERVQHVQTGLDWIRGMRVSDDGRWVALAGEFRGGVEVYEIKGDRGEVWELAARDEGVEAVNCLLWL